MAPLAQPQITRLTGAKKSGLHRLAQAAARQHSRRSAERCQQGARPLGPWALGRADAELAGVADDALQLIARLLGLAGAGEDLAVAIARYEADRAVEDRFELAERRG